MLKNMLINSFAIATGLLLTSMAAQAQTTVFDPSAGQYTFEGMSTLSVSGVAINCQLSLTGSVSKDSSGDVTVNVTAGSADPGDTLCNSVDLVFNPDWTATIPQSQLPPASNKSQLVSNITFNDVIVKYTVLGVTNTCNGGPSPVEASFTNGSPASQPSAFMFDDNIGSCAVNGTLTKDDINVYVNP